MRLGYLVAGVVCEVRKGNDRFVWALGFSEIRVDCFVVVDGSLDRTRHHHGTGLSANLARLVDLRMEVIDHDLGLLPDGKLLTFYICAKLLGSTLGIELGIVFDRLDELVVGIDRDVVREHIEDEFFFDRLLHSVAVEWAMLYDAVGGVRLPECFECLVLRRRGEREI